MDTTASQFYDTAPGKFGGLVTRGQVQVYKIMPAVIGVKMYTSLSSIRLFLALMPAKAPRHQGH